MAKRIPTSKQRDITDCGAACLASVAEYHGCKLPVARIRQFASTDRKGTNVLGLVEAATRMGFVAKGVKGPFEALKSIPKPAIAHVLVKQTLAHYVVVYAVTKRHVVVMDPMDGRTHRWTHAEFQEQWTGVLVLVAPGTDFVATNERASILRRFLTLLRPHRTIMAQALVGAAAYTILGLSTAVYVQKIVDYVLVDGNQNLLNLLSVVMVGVILIQVFLGWMRQLFTLHTGQWIDAALILGYYQHLMRLPQRFFDTMRVGEIISRVNDAVKIRAFINDVSLDLVVNAFVVVFSLTLMFVYSWELGLLVLAMIPVFGIVYHVTNRVNRKTQRSMMERAADLESHLVESLNAVSTIKQFGLEGFANLKTETRFVRLLKSVYVSGTNSIFAANASQLVASLATVMLLWVGGGLAIDRGITPGELMGSYALLGYLTGPLASLIMMNRTVQDAMIAADRLFEVMDLERETAKQRVTLTAEAVGDIHFEQVAFRYGTRTQVFKDLNLKVARGQMTALVGESGSGKSTLVALLQKIYPLDRGHIRIGGIDLRYVSTESLRDIVGVVPQKLDLFAGDVVDNIAVGDLEPDMVRVLRVCELLGLNRVIENMPRGFNTALGENGTALSGGEKQRIAIARALYRDPEILILDEATSALDSASERYVERALEQLKAEGKTVIAIAHRLSTIMRADRIVVLDRGEVVEDGAHRELMQREGRYFDMWRAQVPLGYVLGEPVDTAA
ncbi:MAG: ABC transporter ATP-binding protein [Gemmatimonadota bacterium]